MSIAQVIGVAIGLTVIALVLWNIRRHRRHGDGTIEEPRYDIWMGD